MSEVYSYSFLKKINLCKPDEIKFISWAKLQITGGEGGNSYYFNCVMDLKKCTILKILYRYAVIL